MTRFKQSGQSRGVLRDLYATLDARKRPEDVAEMIVEFLGGELSRDERGTLDKAAKGSLKRSYAGYSSMLQNFAKPVGAETQIRTAEVLFSSATRLSAAECCDPKTVEAYLRTLSAEIHKNFGESDFKGHRLNRAQRRALGLDISKRRYNKLWRILTRIEVKLTTMARELKKLELTKIGKSSLATKLSFEDFSENKDSACFIAYYTARCNLRSQFTVSGQERPYDEIAEMLLERCERRGGNWWAIAHVYPERTILMHLSDEQRGQLLGAWYAVLGDVADILRDVWNSSEIRRDTMVVARGNDSTTWNNTANAWNTARKAWFSLLYAMGLESVLEAVCPGKVLRLMAADVVAWHHCTGGGLSPDTQVWADLPLPWEVLSGEVSCGRDEVRKICRKHQVDSATSGWIMPAPKRKAAQFRATPELVHGVAVRSPALAKTLRKAGWFSGQGSRPIEESVSVQVDAHRFVVGVTDG
jgi:hypothetical protein